MLTIAKSVILFEFKQLEYYASWYLVQKKKSKRGKGGGEQLQKQSAVVDKEAEIMRGNPATEGLGTFKKANR